MTSKKTVHLVIRFTQILLYFSLLIDYLLRKAETFRIRITAINFTLSMSFPNTKAIKKKIKTLLGVKISQNNS